MSQEGRQRLIAVNKSLIVRICKGRTKKLSLSLVLHGFDVSVSFVRENYGYQFPFRGKKCVCGCVCVPVRAWPRIDGLSWFFNYNWYLIQVFSLHLEFNENDVCKACLCMRVCYSVAQKWPRLNYPSLARHWLQIHVSWLEDSQCFLTIMQAESQRNRWSTSQLWSAFLCHE